MSKSKQINVSTIESTLVHTFEKLHQLHLITNPNRVQSASTDTGQEQNLPCDRGMEIILDMIANTIHRQLYYKLTTKDGRSFDNIKERVDKAEELMEAHLDRYGGDREALTVDPRTYELAHQIDLATARFEAMKEMRNGIVATLEHFTQKKWQPRPQESNPMGNGRRIEMTDEAKTAALAALAKIEAKRQKAAT